MSSEGIQSWILPNLSVFSHIFPIFRFFLLSKDNIDIFPHRNNTLVIRSLFKHEWRFFELCLTQPFMFIEITIAHERCFGSVYSSCFCHFLTQIWSLVLFFVFIWRPPQSRNFGAFSSWIPPLYLTTGFPPPHSIQVGGGRWHLLSSHLQYLAYGDREVTSKGKLS